VWPHSDYKPWQADVYARDPDVVLRELDWMREVGINTYLPLALASGRVNWPSERFPDTRALFGVRSPLDAAIRGGDEREELGSPDPRATAMLVLDVSEMRRLGPYEAAGRAVRHVVKEGVEGFWVHLDADVIDDAVNPAVDYRLPGGLGVKELGEVLRALVASDKAVGMDVTIYNPALDRDGQAARAIVQALLTGLRGS
jgi:arginase